MKLSVSIWIEPSFTKTPWYYELISGMQSELGNKRLVPRILETPPIGEKIDTNMLLISGETSAWLNEMILYAQQQHVRVCVASSVYFPSSLANVSFISLNREKDMRAIVHYFVHAGRKKIALWGINPSSPTDQSRLSGYRKAAQELDLALTDEDIYVNQTDAAECAQRLLRRIDKYDGIIASNDLYATYLLNILQSHGHRVPEDLFMASFGNSRLSTLTAPSITTSTLNHYELGRQAIKCTAYMLKNPDVSALSIEIASHCLIRESTANVPFDFILPADRLDAPTSFSSYDDNCLKQIAALESCLNTPDAMTLSILQGIMTDIPLSELAESLFMSESTLGYRLRKLYEQIGVPSRQKLVSLLMSYAPKLQNNPFCPISDDASN